MKEIPEPVFFNPPAPTKLRLTRCTPPLFFAEKPVPEPASIVALPDPYVPIVTTRDSSV